MFPLIHLGRLIGGRYAVDCYSLVCACGAYQEDKKYLEANVSIFVSSQFPCRRSVPSGTGYRRWTNSRDHYGSERIGRVRSNGGGGTNGFRASPHGYEQR